MTSDMHASGDSSLRDLDWTERRWNGVQAYCDSKLFITTLAFALARRWPDRCVNAVSPGWCQPRWAVLVHPTTSKLGHRTQTWLAVSDDPDATTSGGYWHHQRRQTPPAAAVDESFQDALLEELARLTGVQLP
jgi:NAD(P)-dependent dehydrogenase (short-subunit alcohol dehydrogenase family)